MHVQARIPENTLLTARPFNGPGWSAEWQKSAGCELDLARRRWHVLSYYPETETEISRRHGAGQERFFAARGTLGLYPARTAETVTWSGRLIQALHLHIAPERLAARHPGNAGVRRVARFRDPALGRLTGAMYELMRASRPDPAAAASVMDAIIDQLAARYTVPGLPGDTLIGRAGLTPLLDRMYGASAVVTSLDDLVSEAGTSRGYFFRRFRRLTGSTPHDLLLRSRLELAKGRIQAGEGLADIALDCGFADQSHFANAFRRQIGLPASAFAAWFGA
ncbi:AraC family transcriptional regulator [Marinicauda pacifica]|nr:AraC family transcriptional regulator [Marinicauda pacifica]